MRIPENLPKITGIYNKQKQKNSFDKAVENSSKEDIISISDKGKDFQTVMKALKSIPDIRQDKVEKLSKQYRRGNYDVTGNDIAEKIIDSIFDKKI
jgi:negative regulator of flagellin synthesis FlgM